MTVGEVFGTPENIVRYYGGDGLEAAALLCRARRDVRLPSLEIKVQENRVRLAFDASWLEANPLTATALREEVLEWERIGHELKIPGLDEIVLAQEPVLAD